MCQRIRTTRFYNGRDARGTGRGCFAPERGCAATRASLISRGVQPPGMEPAREVLLALTVAVAMVATVLLYRRGATDSNEKTW